MIFRSVEELLAGRPLVGVTGCFTVAAACHRMRECGVGALAVLDGQRLVGILSERDVAIRVIAGHRDPMLTLVREVMTREPATIPAHTAISAALRAMSAGGFRHMPVTRGEAVVGMLSLRDIPLESDVSSGRIREAPVPALG